MKFEKNMTSFRFNDEINKKIQDLIKRFPDDFPNVSRVLKAGVMALHRERSRWGK